MRISYINEKDAFDAWKKIKRYQYAQCKVTIECLADENPCVKILFMDELIILPIKHYTWMEKVRIKFYSIDTHSAILRELLKGCSMTLYHKNLDNIKLGDSDVNRWMDTVIVERNHIIHKMDIISWENNQCIQYLE